MAVLHAMTALIRNKEENMQTSTQKSLTAGTFSLWLVRLTFARFTIVVHSMQLL